MEKLGDISKILIYTVALLFCIFGNLANAGLITLTLVAVTGAFLISIYITICQEYNRLENNDPLAQEEKISKILKQLKKIQDDKKPSK